MSLYCAMGGVEADLLPQLKDLLAESLAKLGQRNRVLAVPLDQSRLHSRAGELTRYAWEYYGNRLKAVLPALGTHTAMQPEQIARMFGAMPKELFLVHNWRTDVETPRRSSGGVHLRAIGEQAELCMAGPGEPAHCTWWLLTSSSPSVKSRKSRVGLWAYRSKLRREVESGK